MEPSYILYYRFLHIKNGEGTYLHFFLAWHIPSQVRPSLFPLVWHIKKTYFWILSRALSLYFDLFLEQSHHSVMELAVHMWVVDLSSSDCGNLERQNYFSQVFQIPHNFRVCFFFFVAHLALNKSLKEILVISCWYQWTAWKLLLCFFILKTWFLDSQLNLWFSYVWHYPLPYPVCHWLLV